jgi:hypothetical protein
MPNQMLSSHGLLCLSYKIGGAARDQSPGDRSR